MSRRSAAGLAGLALVLAVVALRGRFVPSRAPTAPGAGGVSSAPSATKEFNDARARLGAFRSYRELFDRRLVKAARVLDDGAVRMEVDLRGVARPALLRRGLGDLEDAIPSLTTVTVHVGNGRVDESFAFACTGACALDLFADTSAPPGARFLLPGGASAVAVFSLDRVRLGELGYGTAARQALRQRIDVLEQILGRPIRAPLSEDLSGAGVLALYPEAPGRRDRTILALDLRRPDRLRSLVDLVLGLGALTRGAVVLRYDDVPIGSWSSGSGGPAVAVDGPVLFLASDRATIQDALDRRRGDPPPAGEDLVLPDPAGASLTIDAGPACRARLTREGEGWRLQSSGDRPFVESDAVRGWVRSARPRIQRGEG